MKFEIKEDKPDYEYRIYINGKLAWHGLNPEGKYEKFVLML